MNIEKTNKLIIISSPSGAGKTTLCKLLLKKMKNISLSISYTSRNKRVNELNGKDYFFVSKEKFIQLNNNNFFIETAKNFNNLYGSPFKNIIDSKKNNVHLLFDIDWKGARKIRKNFKQADIIDFFILPPSKKELKKRLIKRNQNSNKEIELRYKSFNEDIKHWNDYDYIVINKNLDICFKQIEEIIKNNKKDSFNFFQKSQ